MSSDIQSLAKDVQEVKNTVAGGGTLEAQSVLAAERAHVEPGGGSAGGGGGAGGDGGAGGGGGKPRNYFRLHNVERQRDTEKPPKISGSLTKGAIKNRNRGRRQLLKGALNETEEEKARKAKQKEAAALKAKEEAAARKATVADTLAKNLGTGGEVRPQYVPAERNYENYCQEEGGCKKLRDAIETRLIIAAKEEGVFLDKELERNTGRIKRALNQIFNSREPPVLTKKETDFVEQVKPLFAEEDPSTEYQVPSNEDLTNTLESILKQFEKPPSPKNLSELGL